MKALHDMVICSQGVCHRWNDRGGKCYCGGGRPGDLGLSSKSLDQLVS